MFKKRYIFSIVLILLVTALLSYQSLTGKNRIIDAAAYPLSYIEEWMSDVTRSVSGFFNTYVIFTGKEQEIRRLSGEVKKLEKEKHLFIESELENMRLREILGLQDKRKDFFGAAEVFARDPGNLFQVLWIDKGLDDGVVKDMVVLTPSGLVGRTHRVFSGRSSVILITDLNSSLSVRLQSSRAEGILEGRGSNVCLLRYVPSEVVIKTGERVISSGLDGIFPEGILIGYVTDVINDEGGIFQTIEVRPAQDTYKLEEVALLGR